MRDFVRPTGRLRIDTEAVDECRALAAEIAEPVQRLAADHTTVSIERACLRLVGVDGVEGKGDRRDPHPEPGRRCHRRHRGSGPGGARPVLPRGRVRVR